MSKKEGRIKIIGFGNPYRSDDGIGISIIRRLLQDEVLEKNPDVELIEGGTCGMDLIYLLEDASRLIIIDAVDAGQKDSEVVSFYADEIDKIKGPLKSYSLHDMGLGQVFGIIKAMGIKKDILIIGIKPKTISLGEKLSKEVEEKIPLIIERIKESLL
jgi:hydrogenase maturation protease